MPEGDTVWLTAKRLNAALGGRQLTRADLRVPQLATAGLAGRTITEVVPRGKHLLMRLDDGLTLHSHLKMDGSWRIDHTKPNGYGDHRVRVVLGNDQWTAVGRNIHDLALVLTIDEHQLVGHLGPDLLGPDWDPDEAVRRLGQQPDVEIGVALLDQRNLAGIGNVYKSEALFLTGTNPWTPVKDVADAHKLVTTAQRIMAANREHPEQSTTGSLQRGEQHWVYGRAGQPCRRCRTPIESGKQGEDGMKRTTFWCPECQPKTRQPRRA